MSERELPIGLATFLILGIIPKLTERDWLGRMYIRLGRVLTISAWLYEIGAMLGRFWRDKLPIVMKMFEVEGKRAQFTQFWSEQPKKRLQLYKGEPASFPIFVVQTDLEMFMGKKLEDLLKVGDKKLYHEEGQQWLRLSETSIIEGIMFGAMFPDLTHTMLVNEYEKIDIASWEEARRYGVTLPEKPPHTTVADKEREALALARDYVMEYHPELMGDLGLSGI